MSESAPAPSDGPPASAQPSRAERGTAAAVSAAATFGLVVEHPVVLRSVSTVVVRLEPHPIVARALVGGSGASRGGALGRSIREARLIHHLAAVGAPVVPPSPLLPAGPHVRDGIPVVAAARVGHDPRQPLSGARLAATLAEVHAGLRSYAGSLPPLPHLDETSGWLSRPEVQAAVEPGARARFAAAVDAARSLLASGGLPVGPLHGDAHSGNALIDRDGTIRWGDLEDACTGPVEWDLACLAATALIFGGDAAMAADALETWADYDDSVLDTLVRARGVQVVAWGFLAAAADPRRARAAHQRADRLLAYLAHP